MDAARLLPDPTRAGELRAFLGQFSYDVRGTAAQ